MFPARAKAELPFELHSAPFIPKPLTGRQVLRGPGYEVDIERILEACAAHGVAVEIDANPWRLDLDWRWHERALELGCHERSMTRVCALTLRTGS